MFIKKTIKDLKKVKTIRKYVFKCNLYLYFLAELKCQQNSSDVPRDSYIYRYFGSSLNKVELCQVLSL